jgi:hypothetical protein
MKSALSLAMEMLKLRLADAVAIFSPGVVIVVV